jgi:type IV pilus assembly protein PilE
MVVLVIIAIFTAIAIPSYQEYARRADVSMVQQEMQKIAEQLERHKSKTLLIGALILIIFTIYQQEPH